MTTLRDADSIIEALAGLSLAQPTTASKQSTQRRASPAAEFTGDGSLTGLVYDERCALHECNYRHVEQPARITEPWKLLGNSGLAERCAWIAAREATDAELTLTHAHQHVHFIDRTAAHPYKVPEPDSESDEPGVIYNDCIFIDSDTYANVYSARAARLACGGLIDLLSLVHTRQLKNGFALVRPPGHHSFAQKAGGFCLYNNVAVAIKALLNEHPSLKLAIVDWDVHHGDGSQSIFYDSDRVLYLSTHRHERGMFYPGTGAATDTGTGAGTGFNVNFPFTSRAMGDSEYEIVFDRVFVPIIQQFEPDMIVVSAGFDCAMGDPLGGMEVSPAGFARLTHRLLSVSARVPVVMALEGGYNIPVISESIANCVKVLMGEQPPSPSSTEPQPQSTPLSQKIFCSGRRQQFELDLATVMKIQSMYWQLEMPVASEKQAQTQIPCKNNQTATLPRAPQSAAEKPAAIGVPASSETLPAMPTADTPSVANLSTATVTATAADSSPSTSQHDSNSVKK